MRQVIVAVCGVGFACVLATSCQAQQPARELQKNQLTITVTGEAVGRPDVAVVNLTSEATAGSASDALERCKTKADAAVKAIDDLGIENATIDRQMYKFSSPTVNPYVGMGSSTAQPAGTKVSQLITVEIPIDEDMEQATLADAMAKILDAANKNGIGLGRQPSMRAQIQGMTAEPIEYVLKDATDLRAAAFKDAKAKAEGARARFAEQGVKSGPLVGAYYGETPRPDSAAWLVALAGGGEPGDKKSASSSSPTKVSVESTLTFVYHLPAQ